MTSLWHRSAPDGISRWLRGAPRQRSLLGRLLQVAALTGLSLLALRAIPDLKRYLRMRRL